LGSCTQATVKTSNPDSTTHKEMSVHLSLLLLANAGAAGCWLL